MKTIKEIKSEIVSKILEIPMENWKDDETQMGDNKVIFRPTHTNYPKYFEVDGVEFHDERVYDFIKKKKEYEDKKYEQYEKIKVNEIYNKI